MTHRGFRQVDVFGKTPLAGNPLAVVLDADGISDEQLLRFTHWTGLSEATFLLPTTDPAADYRVRIFTGRGELPFAGHPTLGSAHAWLEAGGVPRNPELIVQECGVGLVRIRRSGATLAFTAPETIRSGPVDEATLSRVVHVLGIEPDAVVDHQWTANGPNFLTIRLGSAAEVLAVEPDTTKAPDLAIGLVGFYPAGSSHAYEVRALGHGLPNQEDPVTGSLNAAIAQWLLREGLVTGSWTAGQGSRVGHDGTVTLEVDGDGSLWVGGAAVTVVSGTVEL